MVTRQALKRKQINTEQLPVLENQTIMEKKRTRNVVQET